MIGISLGSMNTSVAYSECNNNGKLITDIILSETSSRVIPSVVGYSKSHRMIGEHATSTIRKHINSTFSHINRMAGLKINCEYTNRESDFFSGDYETKIHNNEILYKLPLNNEEMYLPSESLLAAFINKIKNDLIIGLHKKLCFAFTVGVHDYMTIGQRETLSRALKICEVDNYYIINESSAITLYYGYNRYKNLFLEKDSVTINPNTSKYILFIDMGHSKTTFIVSEFRPSFFRVASCESDPFLGGRDMDKLVYNHLATIFYNQTKVDITKNKKSSFRLLEQITKARKILTGNQETLISIDCLYEDYDFSYMLKRSEFESLVKPILDKFANSLSKFYKSTLNVIDKTISAVEMAGECMRIPIISQIVKEATGKEMQKSMIVDEAVSKGCSLYSALVNNVFPLPNFNGIYNYNNYSIVYHTKSDSSSSFLIHKGEPTPINKLITYNLNQGEEIINLSFFYLKHEVEFISNGFDSITELNINLGELLKLNGVKFVPDNKIIIDVLIDNSGKPILQNIKTSKEENLKLDLNVLCLNPIVKYEAHFRNPHIMDRAEEYTLLENLKKVEFSHFQQDEHIKELHMKKNQIESNVYKLKNKYLEKESEYENLHNKFYPNEPQRTLLSRLNSVEQAIQSSESIESSTLENVGQKVKEIETIINKTYLSASPRKGQDSSYKAIKDRIDFYTGLVDQEYVKILEGKSANLDEKTINLISEILSKYRILFETCEEKDLNAHYTNLEKEMKKYFK